MEAGAENRAVTRIIKHWQAKELHYQVPHDYWEKLLGATKKQGPISLRFDKNWPQQVAEAAKLKQNMESGGFKELTGDLLF